jgi:predicted nucleotidyltransferase
VVAGFAKAVGHDVRENPVAADRPRQVAVSLPHVLTIGKVQRPRVRYDAAVFRRADILARRDEILALARRHGGTRVRLIGSVARDEATEESDVDFVVDFEPERSLLDQGGLLMDLRKFLGCKVDVVSAGGVRGRFAARVEEEGVTL